VLIDTTEWSAEDNDAWECMTDSERNGYGVDYVPRRRWAWRFDPQRGLPHGEVTTIWEGSHYE
jgi:hypothetical protein